MSSFGSFVKTGSLVSIVVIIVAVLYKRRSDELLQQRLDQVLSGLQRAENKVKSSDLRVALGFGGDIDLFVNAVELFSKINATPPDTTEHFEEVGTKEELEKLFAYFFQHGAAAERYVYNTTLFHDIVEAAYSLPRRRPSLGGAAIMMGKRLAKEGLDVLVGACFTKKTLEQFKHKGMRVVGRELTEDDIHLIMEYSLGEHWGKYRSPRANRLILHSDMSSPILESMEEFQKEVLTFNPSLFILGGLQMMDKFPFPPGVREQKFSDLKTLLQKTPKSTKIHFEMASFSDIATTGQLVRNVLPYTDSLGMNEQELPNLVSILTEGNVTHVANSNPRVATILDQMRVIYKTLKDTHEVDGKRALTRLHVHTLAFQAILTKSNSIWKNTMSAAAKASLTAHRYICGTDEVNTLRARILMDESFSTSNISEAQRIQFQNNRPVSCWTEEDYELCVAPVLVCTKVLQTAGGGDNISSAGLVLQI